MIEFGHARRFGLLATAVVIPAAPATAQLFGPGDHIIAIDVDEVVNSAYPGAEGPDKVADQISATKYLNFGKTDTGLIITPGSGAAVVQSLRFTTANDEPARDPASYALYGTNDAITSGDNSGGGNEDWSLISSGGLNLPTDREVPGSVHDFANAVSYSSYKVIFPTLRDSVGANSMQVADFSLFTNTGGGGSQILSTGDAAIAVADPGSASDYPAPEGPANAIDGTLNKYLNFAGRNSGLIVERADGLPTIVDSFVITTANDADGRDPSEWMLYGTNDSVTSADNSLGMDEAWTLIDAGSVALPADRDTAGPEVTVNNTDSYTAYRMVFSELKNPNEIMQIAEITFDGFVVPAPSSLALLAMGGLAMRRRRI